MKNGRNKKQQKEEHLFKEAANKWWVLGRQHHHMDQVKVKKTCRLPREYFCSQSNLLQQPCWIQQSWAPHHHSWCPECGPWQPTLHTQSHLWARRATGGPRRFRAMALHSQPDLRKLICPENQLLGDCCYWRAESWWLEWDHRSQHVYLLPATGSECLYLPQDFEWVCTCEGGVWCVVWLIDNLPSQPARKQRGLRSGLLCVGTYDFGVPLGEAQKQEGTCLSVPLPVEVQCVDAVKAACQCQNVWLPVLCVSVCVTLGDMLPLDTEPENGKATTMFLSLGTGPEHWAGVQYRSWESPFSFGCTLSPNTAVFLLLYVNYSRKITPCFCLRSNNLTAAIPASLLSWAIGPPSDGLWEVQKIPNCKKRGSEKVVFESETFLN